MCREAVPQAFMNLLDEQAMSCARDIQAEDADVQTDACHSNSDQSDSRSQGATSSHAVFFARVPPNVPYEELHGVFSKYGTVTNLNLYRRWATAKTSKGCGLVEYTTQEEAQAAMDALNGNYRFDSYPGSEAPMVVEWMDASRLTPPAATKPRKSNKNQSKSNKLPSRTSSSSGSSSSSSSTRRQVWPFPATQYAAHNRAAAAAAAAAANYDTVLQTSAFGLHPANDALGPYAQVLSPGACDAAAFGSSFVSGVEPMAWGSGVPVQLVPMLCNNGRQTNATPQQQFSNPMANPQAAAFAMALSSMGGGLNTMSQPLATPFAGYRPANTDSGNMTLAEPSMSCSSAQLLPVPASFMAAHRLQMAGGLGYPAAAGLRDELRPQDGSILAALCGNGTAPARAATLSGAPSLSGASSSGSYTLFDSATLLGQMQDSASAAAAALNAFSCPGGQTHMLGPGVASGTALSAPAPMGGAADGGGDFLGSRHIGSFSGAMPGALPSLLAQLNAGLVTNQPQVTPCSLASHALVTRAGSLEDCMVLPPPALERDVGYADITNTQDQCLASPWGGSLGQGRGGAMGLGRVGSMGQEQQGLRELLVPLNGNSSSSLLVHAPSVAAATGATCDVKGTPEGGLVLRIEGAEGQVQAAWQLMRALA